LKEQPYGELESVVMVRATPLEETSENTTRLVSLALAAQVALDVLLNVVPSAGEVSEMLGAASAASETSEIAASAIGVF
jgi:hypothetical protein